MSRFAKKAAPTKTRNLAGGVAYRMGAEQELVHAVLTTFLEDKFYENGNERLERIQKLVRENKPQFVANLAVVARLEFNLRSVTHVLLGELSKIHRGDSLVKEAIVRAAVRPDDLTELVAYVGTPLPKQVKRGVRNALLKFNRYQLAKYRGEGKTVSLVDLFNLTHPKTKHANKEQKQAWKDLIKGKLISEDTWETEISNAKDDKARTKAWETLIKNDDLGYMAMLRNLNNLVKYKVSESVVKKVVEKLTDPEQIKKSKQLPFRYWTAYNMVQGNRAFTDAISEAMDIAVSNAPEFAGKTLIAVDSSGSMKSGKDAMSPIIKAAIFAATLCKSNPRAEIILYDTRLKGATLSSRTPVVDIANSIVNEAMGGGTQTSLVFEYATKEQKKFDRIIILSDGESWAESFDGGVNKFYQKYCKTLGVNPYVYAVDIEGYGTKDITGTRVFHLTGWSDRLLDFMGRVEEGESLVEYVKNYQL